MGISFFEWIFNQGVRRRNPSLFAIWQDLKKSENWDIHELKNLQLERLRLLLQFACDKSPYYRNLYRDLDLHPEHMEWSQLKKLPPVTKTELIQNAEHIRTDRNHTFNKVFHCETSGTSGEVLNFVRNEYWDSFNRAAVFKCFEWYGVKPWEFNIYFWGYNTRLRSRLKLRLTDYLMHRWRVFDYNESTLKKVMKKLKKARFIEGYSSMIYELARINQHTGTYPFLRMVKGTSEKIYPHYKEEAIKAFGIPIINEYGAAESGLIAFECPHGNMHMNMEGCIVETDENNEILLTNLLSYSFPVIRYKLGDVVKLKPEDFQCSCGRKHLVIEEVTGRIGKTIMGNEHIYPSLTLYYIFKNLYFDHNLKLNYQGHQSVKGEMELWIDVPLDENLSKTVLNECVKYFDSDLKITLVERKDFRMKEGKLRDFITTLN